MIVRAVDGETADELLSNFVFFELPRLGSPLVRTSGFSFEVTATATALEPNELEEAIRNNDVRIEIIDLGVKCDFTEGIFTKPGELADEIMAKDYLPRAWDAAELDGAMMASGAENRDVDWLIETSGPLPEGVVLKFLKEDCSEDESLY